MRDDAIPVEMTMIECFWTAQLGAWRRMSGWKNALNANKHAPKSDWATDIDGVLAEMAVAKWLGVYYEPRNMDFKGPDVGRRCQIGSTTYVHGHLIVRPNDEKLKDQPFVLAITQRSTVWLVGWRYGGECMKDQFKIGDHWEVPQSALEPMSKFPVPRQKSLFSA
jgi:hypothetical protein